MKPLRFSRVVALFGTLLGASSLASSLLAASFQVTPLGLYNGLTFEPHALNNRGEVVGEAYGYDPYNPSSFALLYSRGTITNLGSLGGSISRAYGINDHGDVVGTSYLAGDNTWHAFLYRNGAMQDLGTLGGAPISEATDINNSGQIAGFFSSDDGTMDHAFVWQNGVFTDLGAFAYPDEQGDLVYSSSFAGAINEAGVVVGSTVPYHTPPSSAVRWTNGEMIHLPRLPGFTTSGATDINNHGAIVGYSGHVYGETRPTLFSGDTAIDLGSFGGQTNIAMAINDAGGIVGYSENAGGGWRAFLYQDNQMLDLNDLIGRDDVYLVSAVDINEHGQILAFGTGGQPYLLTPISEPSTYAPAFGAITLLAILLRRARVRPDGLSQK